MFPLYFLFLKFFLSFLKFASNGRMSTDEMIREKLHPNMVKLYLKRFSYIITFKCTFSRTQMTRCSSYAIKNSSHKRTYNALSNSLTRKILLQLFDKFIFLFNVSTSL